MRRLIFIVLLLCGIIGLGSVPYAASIEEEDMTSERTPQQRLRDQNALHDLVAPGLDAGQRIDGMMRVGVVKSVRITRENVTATLITNSVLVGNAVQVDVRDVQCLAPVAVGDRVLWGQPNGPRSLPVCWGTVTPPQSYGLPQTTFNPRRTATLSLTGGTADASDILRLDNYAVRGLSPYYLASLSGNIVTERNTGFPGAEIDLFFRFIVRRSGTTPAISILVGAVMRIEVPSGTGPHTTQLSVTGLYGDVRRITDTVLNVAENDEFNVFLEFGGLRATNTGNPASLNVTANIDSLSLVEVTSQLAPLTVAP